MIDLECYDTYPSLLNQLFTEVYDDIGSLVHLPTSMSGPPVGLLL